jgi:hypothetical protein
MLPTSSQANVRGMDLPSGERACAEAAGKDLTGIEREALGGACSLLAHHGELRPERQPAFFPESSRRRVLAPSRRGRRRVIGE